PSFLYQDKEFERTPCCAQVGATVEEQRAKPRRLQRQPTRSFTIAVICARCVASPKFHVPRESEASLAERLYGGPLSAQFSRLALGGALMRPPGPALWTRNISIATTAASRNTHGAHQKFRCVSTTKFRCVSRT